MKILEAADDVTPEIEQHVRDTVDWFEDEPTMPTDEFIDRLCNTYGGEGWDLESYDNPAARKIMRIARQEKRGRVA